MKELICLFLLTLSAPVFSQQGWQDLFNGKDLKGWKVLGEDATFEVQDGMVVGTNQGRHNTFLATRKTYSDFILELEVWADPRMNSGIQFRSAQNEKGRVYGYQAEIDPSARAYSGGIYDEARRDWLYPLSLNPAGQSAFKVNEWNTYRIEAYGNSIRVWVNGICTAVMEDDETAEGFIALQVHGVGKKEEEGRQAKWRNVKLLTRGVADQLNPIPENIYQLNLVTGSLTPHEMNQGWIWLWDLAAMEGESAYQYKWEVADVMLYFTVDKNDNVNFSKDLNNREFELSFQYWLAPDSEASMFYLVDKYMKGKRYQIVDTKKYPREEDRKRPGALLDEIAPENLSWAGMGERYLAPKGNWHQGRIVVRETKIEHWMNGFKIVEYDRPKDLPANGGQLIIEPKIGKMAFQNLKYRAIR